MLVFNVLNDAGLSDHALGPVPNNLTGFCLTVSDMSSGSTELRLRRCRTFVRCRGSTGWPVGHAYMRYEADVSADGVTSGENGGWYGLGEWFNDAVSLSVPDEPRTLIIAACRGDEVAFLALQDWVIEHDRA